MSGEASRFPEVTLSDLPVLDPKLLQDLLDLGAPQGLVQELIALFQEDVPERIAALRMALGSLDAGQTLQEAHQLKGALGNMGLVRFADMASRIEIHAREGHLEQAPVVADALSAAYDQALLALIEAFPEV
jgi:HPt (histidine-containing phosphotransfer) domain-containing protein